jgi:hypothetical protein
MVSKMLEASYSEVEFKAYLSVFMECSICFYDHLDIQLVVKFVKC